MANKTNNENLLGAPVPEINVEVLTPQRCLLVHAGPSYASSSNKTGLRLYTFTPLLIRVD